MILTHNKKHFYKYVSSSSAIAILESCSIKVSRATEFNDPFDTFHELRFDFDNSGVAALFIAKFKELIMNRIEIDLIDPNPFGLMINAMIRSGTYHDPDLSTVASKITEKIDFVDKLLENSNREWKDYLMENRIFCMSETYDNLLMWSHYADSHKGAVIRLKVFPEGQSALCAAAPIIYSSFPPNLGTFDEMFYSSIGAVKRDTMRIQEKQLFTKSIIWNYEKEWRYTVKQRDASKAYDINRIDPREIDGIYLGCKIEEDDKAKIIKHARKYPKMEIYQGSKSNKEYKLDFNIVSYIST